MRIYMERSGGFMGRKVRTAVDTSALPVEEARNLQEMVDETHFFELPPVLEDGEGVDRFQYKVTVETTERRHTVETSEVAAPAELQALLRRLTLLSRMQYVRPAAPDAGENAAPAAADDAVSAAPESLAEPPTLPSPVDAPPDSDEPLDHHTADA